jgi:hypothetical protein
MTQNPYFTPPIFETDDNTPRMYTQRFGTTNMIWAQQNNPTFNEDLKGNIPDPVLQTVVRGVSEDLRKRMQVLTKRDNTNAKQIRFNATSGTSTSYVGSREDANENYNYLLNTQKVEDSNVLQKVLLAVVIYYAFFARG